MSVRLKGTDTSVKIRWIPKYTLVERALHWVHTATFIPLALTGFVMFAPWLQSVAQGNAGMHIRLLHRIFAVFFGLVPIAYTIIQPKRMWMNLKEFLSFGKDDLLWLKGAIPYYVLGRHEDMTPQPRFNTGERLTACIMVLGTITFAMFMVHFYLAVVHPMMWQSLVAMRYGVVSESYAREHHGKWYYGKERAMEIWEQHQTQDAH
jgi:formate dehydrogenase subunit gamma